MCILVVISALASLFHMSPILLCLFFFLAGDFWAYSGYVHVYIVPHADRMLFTCSCVTVGC